MRALIPATRHLLLLLRRRRHHGGAKLAQIDRRSRTSQTGAPALISVLLYLNA